MIRSLSGFNTHLQRQEVDMLNKIKDESLIIGDRDRRIREAVQVANRLYSDVPPHERTQRVAKQVDRIASRALRDLNEDLSELENMYCG